MVAGRRRVWFAVGLMLVLSASVASAQPRLVVTATELMQRNHLLEVAPGTEVVWAGPHFERVWFPPRADGPQVERAEGGFHAVFDKPGTYRGLFTLFGWRTGDLYQMTVVVREGT